ncbi:hypothetical protein B0H12DRAFT_1157454 [Mycena haematopus]|nr:hypothetical protein B0H12DRAFT_1157454 [Mycena haematopus]
MDSLTPPKLRSLSLTCTFQLFPDTPFLSFLQRAPGIQTFSVQSFGLSLQNGAVLTPILGAMTALTSLELRFFPVNSAFGILRRLNQSVAFLPILQKLVFFGLHMEWEDRFTPILLDALRSRSENKSRNTQLVDFQLVLLYEPAATVAKLNAELSDVGMRVYVGHGL